MARALTLPLPSSLGYRQTVRHGGRRIRQSSCSGLCLEHLAREIMLMHLWDPRVTAACAAALAIPWYPASRACWGVRTSMPFGLTAAPLLAPSCQVFLRLPGFGLVAPDMSRLVIRRQP